jgi:antitoxin ParD1/3/4
MAMTSLNISLPDLLKAYVEEQVAAGDFGTPSEFVRSLIREDKEKRRERLEADLLRALETKQLVVAQEELAGRSLVSVLREKLAKP